MNWEWVNRLLWAGLVLAVSAVSVMRLTPVSPSVSLVDLGAGGEAAAALPAVSGQPLGLPAAPARNVFDPNGERWRSETRKRPKPAKKVVESRDTEKPLPKIRGVMNLPGYQAVVVGDKLVPTGGRVEGVVVEAIRPGETVVMRNGRASTVVVESAKAKSRETEVGSRFADLPKSTD